jgi:S-adenosylmethionine decarboxylase
MQFKILSKKKPRAQRAVKIRPKLSKHCLGTIVTATGDKLFDGPACLAAVQDVLAENGVKCLGEQMYEFPNKSFTMLVALAESHISIHTWPERLTVQLDVFLCNYLNDNTQKCENIYSGIVDYFEAVENSTTHIERL